ncbi:hypothetical protein PVAND_001822 [Polypedilum vanderplanki]|uniref:Uncharacterized protein n=1 Tax=Polypedilum vanderplanki TaxID=319348 RepID=A0A9J6BQF9_POLVA|nr:hypothetical protein PVAND_001822 [Polypedilum vanderplanki]
METTLENQNEQTPEELKEKGNECVKENNFKQAIKFYSEALRKSVTLGLDLHTISVLFSNRSFAYLKDKKYFYALSDAEKTIELSPDWLKGYFRKAEVLKECCLYDEAILSYGRSLKLEPTNGTILCNLKQTAALCNRENMFEKNVPFVGAGCGLIFAVIIVILDQIAVTKKSMQNPIFMVALIMILSFLGFLIAKLVRYFIKLQRKGLIQEPTQLSDEFLVFEQQSTERNDEEEEIPKRRNRYNKSQARLRFKKGKS